MFSSKKYRMVTIAVILLALVLLFFLGPRPRVSEKLPMLSLPADLESHLKLAEARFDDLKAGTQKTIIWADAAKKEKTTIAMVYLHGFSASRQETAPLSDQVARQLGANLFYTRLRGHGRSGAAMGAVTVNDWLVDAQEAMEIGKRLGEQVVLVGSSTGATLCVWLAHQPQWQPDVLALVLISPNFGPKDPGARVLLWPWGAHIARVSVGQTRSFEPANQGHSRYWTTRYPVDALLPMMGLVQMVADKNFAHIKCPVLMVYSKHDRVVDSRRIEAAFKEIGADRKRLLEVNTSEDPSHHVLAGDILSPSTTDGLAQEIVVFINPLRP